MPSPLFLLLSKPRWHDNAEELEQIKAGLSGGWKDMDLAEKDGSFTVLSQLLRNWARHTRMSEVKLYDLVELALSSQPPHKAQHAAKAAWESLVALDNEELYEAVSTQNATLTLLRAYTVGEAFPGQVHLPSKALQLISQGENATEIISSLKTLLGAPLWEAKLNGMPAAAWLCLHAPTLAPDQRGWSVACGRSPTKAESEKLCRLARRLLKEAPHNHPYFPVAMAGLAAFAVQQDALNDKVARGLLSETRNACGGLQDLLPRMKAAEALLDEDERDEYRAAIACGAMGLSADPRAYWRLAAEFASGGFNQGEMRVYYSVCRRAFDLVPVPDEKFWDYLIPTADHQGWALEILLSYQARASHVASNTPMLHAKSLEKALPFLQAFKKWRKEHSNQLPPIDLDKLAQKAPLYQGNDVMRAELEAMALDQLAQPAGRMAPKRF